MVARALRHHTAAVASLVPRTCGCDHVAGEGRDSCWRPGAAGRSPSRWVGRALSSTQWPATHWPQVCVARTTATHCSRLVRAAAACWQRHAEAAQQVLHCRFWRCGAAWERSQRSHCCHVVVCLIVGVQVVLCPLLACAPCLGFCFALPTAGQQPRDHPRILLARHTVLLFARRTCTCSCCGTCTSHS